MSWPVPESSSWGRLPGDGNCSFSSLTNAAKKCPDLSLNLYSQCLAVIQIINKNQPRKTESHPLLLLLAHLPVVGTGLGWEAGSG